MSEPSPRRTFVLGLGAQKAGTTWLYSYLKGSPEFAGGYRKEYHVFDSLDLESERRSRERIISLAEAALAAAREGRKVDADVLHRMSMYADPSYYFDYFAQLVSRTAQAHVTADVTPSYALLGERRLRRIRKGFAERGVRTVAVFLMRDPVDRVWSQLRMQKDRYADRMARSPEELLLRRHALPAYAARSEYHRTLAAVDAAFPPGDVHLGLYETLFSEESVAAICAAVGIAPHPPELDVRRNAATASSPLSEEAVRTVAHHFRDVYPAVAARFPELDLTEVWPSARYVL